MADFTPVFGTGLTINQRVTSPQLNQLDADHVNSLNRTGGTITGAIVVNLTGGIIFQTNAVLQMQNLSLLELSSGAILLGVAGSNTILDGYINVGTTGTMFVNGTETINPTGKLLSDGYVAFYNGAFMSGIASGSVYTLDITNGSIGVNTIAVTNDAFIVNGGFSGIFEAIGSCFISAPIQGLNSIPLNFGLINVSGATSMTISAANSINPYIFISGSLSANSTLTINTAAAMFYIIDVSQLTFNSHTLFVTNALGGSTITTTPAGTPSSNFIFFASCRNSGTALGVSTTTIV